MLLLCSSLALFAQEFPLEVSFSAGMAKPQGAYKEIGPNWQEPAYRRTWFAYDNLGKRNHGAAESGSYFSLDITYQLKAPLGIWTGYFYSQNSFDEQGFASNINDRDQGLLFSRNIPESPFILSSELRGRQATYSHPDYQVHSFLVGYTLAYQLAGFLELSWKQGLGIGSIGGLEYELTIPTSPAKGFSHTLNGSNPSSLMLFFGGKLGFKISKQAELGLNTSFLYGNFQYNQKITFSDQINSTSITDSINFRNLNLGVSLLIRMKSLQKKSDS